MIFLPVTSVVFAISWIYSGVSAFNPYSSTPYSLKYVDEQEFLSVIDNETLLQEGRLFRPYEGSDVLCYQRNTSSLIQHHEEDTFNSEGALIEAVNMVNAILAPNPIEMNTVPISYWTYIISSGETRTVVQKGYFGETYLLGNSSNYNSTIDYHFAKSKTGRVYLSETLVDGCTCDLTHKPREVEIQYICPKRPLSRPFHLEVREIQSCKYQLRLFLPQLCELSSFNPLLGQLSEHNIICHRSGSKLSPALDIFNRYSATVLDHGIYLLKPKNSAKDRRQLMYHAAEPLDSQTTLFELTVEERFIGDFISSLKKLIGSDFIQSPTGKSIKPGDLFLWRAPVVDETGNLLFLIDLELNSASEAIGKVNNDASLLNELPIHNMVYFDSMTVNQTDETSSNSLPEKSTGLVPDIFATDEIESPYKGGTAQERKDKLMEAFRDIGYPDIEVEILEEVVEEQN